MKAAKQITGWLLCAALASGMVAYSQARAQKPALIRDTDLAEGKEEADIEKEKPYDPLKAERSVEVGNFYFKRKNYTAAIQRYLEALQYQPNRFDAYEALGRTYEKTGEISKAVEIFRDFILKNPDSPKILEFRSKLAKLESKLGRKS